MNATEKYLFEMRMTFLADDAPMTDADLDAMLGASGPAADPVKRSPKALTAAGLAGLLGEIIERSNRRLEAAAEVFGLDLERLRRTEEQNGDVDRVTANMVALEREFSRRGPTARPLTKWILANAERLHEVMDGQDREQVIREVVGYFEGRNAGGKCNVEYAEAVRQYFDPKREADDTECKLAACCVLFGLDRESVTERAAILEYDAWVPRTAATMRAVWYALREKEPDISEMTAQAFFDYWDQKRGWNGTESFEWMDALLKSVPGPGTSSASRPSVKKVPA